MSDSAVLEAPAKVAPRLKQKYETEIKAALRDQLGLTNPMQVPKLDKIVINMGVGKATQQPSLLEAAVRDLTSIAGQKPIVTIGF
jgi:large subunit ribosomal protein L5